MIRLGDQFFNLFVIELVEIEVIPMRLIHMVGRADSIIECAKFRTSFR